MQITRNHAKAAEIFQIKRGLNPVTRVTEREFSRGQGRPCDPRGRPGRDRLTAKGAGAPGAGRGRKGLPGPWGGAPTAPDLGLWPLSLWWFVMAAPGASRRRTAGD